MDTVLGTFDFVTANLATIVTVAFAMIGLLSQAAAVFNLAGLAQVSTTLHDAVQFAAGNWGKAVNTVKIVETYRTAGPAAALAELAALAAPAAPKDGGVPPGSAPAALLLAVALGAGGLIACAPLSAKNRSGYRNHARSALPSLSERRRGRQCPGRLVPGTGRVGGRR